MTQQSFILNYISVYVITHLQSKCNKTKETLIFNGTVEAIEVWKLIAAKNPVLTDGQ